MQVGITVPTRNVGLLQSQTSPRPSPILGEGEEAVFPSPLVGERSAKKRTAFTLAEVLITLGIIGVVAAMTLPTLVAKYQMKTFEVAFKKQYSVLNNTIDYLMLENGLSECYLTISKNSYYANSSDCNALKSGMIEKLKLTPIKNDLRYNTNINEILANGGTAVNESLNEGFTYIRRFSAYLLPDGATVLFAEEGKANDLTHNFYGICFIVDVNGKKGPNKWGYDVFWLTLTRRDNGKVRLSDEYESLAEKGGRLPRAILTDGAADDNKREWR